MVDFEPSERIWKQVDSECIDILILIYEIKSFKLSIIFESFELALIKATIYAFQSMYDGQGAYVDPGEGRWW